MMATLKDMYVLSCKLKTQTHKMHKSALDLEQNTKQYGFHCKEREHNQAKYNYR